MSRLAPPLSAQAFARVARIFDPAESVRETLDQIAELAVELIGGCDSASVSLARGGTMTTTAASDELATRADDLQRDTGEGPCLEAIWENESLLVDDLRDDDRFPAFRPGAAQLGICSVMAYRLFDHAADDAFDLLRRASQHLNVKLRDVSQRVVDGDELPR